MMNRLDEWNELFSELKDSHGFTPLFIFEPAIQDSAEYRQKLDHAKLTYPVFSDYHRTFRRSNPDIAGILTDCDCVQADASTYSIAPGRTCIITVSFAPEDIGHFEHHVFIQTAGCSDETHLIITGNSISFG